MKFDNTDDTLILHLEGEVNSVTSPLVETEIGGIIDKTVFHKVILDLQNVTYVSSAGLRILLKLKQKYNDVAVRNASLEVYDVLQMTGFTNIMSVSKAMRHIDITNAELIGEGYFSIVYRIDKDTIIKVCRRATDVAEVERELNLAKQAFILGIPTAISYDIVIVNDGKLGLVFELLDNVLLRDLFRDKKNRYNELVNKYVALLKKINTTEVASPALPDAKQQWLHKIDAIRPYLDEKWYSKARKMLEEIPDRNTYIHGDCHFKNIMIQGDELFLIDMDTLCKGHPIFELAAIYAPYVAFEEDAPGNTQAFLGVSKELAESIYNDVVDRYFDNPTDALRDKIKLVCYIHMVWWNRVNEPENNVRLEGCRGRLIKLLEKYDDVLID